MEQPTLEASTAQSDTLRKLHPAILKVWRIGSLIACGIFALISVGLVAVAIFTGVRGFWFAAALTALPAIMYLWSALSFINRQYAAWKYAVRERDLLVSFGVWWRTRRCIPRERVQHVDIASGPIDRAFGIVQVSVYTAGTITAVVTIPGVAPQEAERLRAQLVDESARYPSPLPEPPHVVAPSPVTPGDRAD